MTTPQRIEQAKVEIEIGESFRIQEPREPKYQFTESELNALLLQIQDEQKEICANKVTRTVFEHSMAWIKNAIREAEHAYNPKEKV